MTSTATHAGDKADLLSGILGVEIRNEEKITAQDRLFCEKQQKMLYNALEQIDQWYGIFTKEAEKYRESHRISYKENGEIRHPYSTADSEYKDYTVHMFKPFKVINELVSSNLNANKGFAQSIIGYFNRTYNVSVPVPEINWDTLKMGSRPQYMTYVDAVIEHLGGRSFRKTAEDELIKRFLQLVMPNRWSKVKPELKGDKISFPNIIAFDSFYYEYKRTNHVHYNDCEKISTLCEGIAFGSDDVLCGDSKMVIRLNQDNVDISGWYDLTTVNATGIKFFRNGRVDVRFQNREAASLCFNRLRLDELRLQEE